MMVHTMRAAFIRKLASILRDCGYEVRRLQRPRAAIDDTRKATTDKLRAYVAAKHRHVVHEQAGQ